MTVRTGSSCWIAVLLALWTLPVQAADAPQGKVLSPTASLLSRGPDAWVALKQDANVPDDSRLLALPGSHGELQIKELKLGIWGNVPEFDNFPVLESMVTFNPARKGADLDFTLNRGRVLLAKPMTAKPMTVRLRFAQSGYDLVLPTEAVSLALEEYARWPLGIAFKKNPGPKDAPFTVVTLYQLTGDINIKVGSEQHLVRAGFAFNWDNLTGADGRPTRTDPVPAWTKGYPNTPESKAMQAAVAKLQGDMAKQPVAKSIQAALESDDASLRALGVYSAAALGNLPRLVTALGDAKHGDVRELAINSLRHWLGQQADHPAELYRYLTSDLKYPEAQGEIALQLLHSFPDGERDRPETYEHLIEYLKHDKLPIRELAKSHLYRWVIAGRKIPYDAASSATDRDKAYQAWKKLIPTGKLPPKADKP